MPSQQRPIFVTVSAIVVSSLVLVGLFAMMTFTALAQGGGNGEPTLDPNQWYNDVAAGNAEWNVPYFEPGTSSGDAIWDVGESDFSSRYPRGFEFETTVESTGGEIVAASVIWSHAPNELKRRDADINPVTGEVSLRWFPDESLPPWLAVNYYWSFEDEKGNRHRTDWYLGEEYEDTTGNWSRFESDEVIVVVQEGLPVQIANVVLEAMASQQATFEQAWGGRLDYKPRVILFASRDDFNQWRGGFGGGVIGQTSENWGATVQVIVDDDVNSLVFSTVLHEIAHLYQFEYVPNGFPAGSWFTEGNATFFELSQDYDYEGRVREFALSDELPILLQGDGPISFGGGPDGNGRWGYDVGYTFWAWLVDSYGIEAHLQVVELLAADATQNEALMIVTGLDIDSIEREWRIWLGASEDVPRFVPTPTNRPFPPTVTPFQFNN